MFSLLADLPHLFLAFSPQLGARLRVTHTQLNFVGMAGNGTKLALS